MKERKPNRRNQVLQVIILKDGSKKVIWHKKKFNDAAYGDVRSFWRHQNVMPKPNSKRQQKLRAITAND